MPWLWDEKYQMYLLASEGDDAPPDPYENKVVMNPIQKLVFILCWVDPRLIGIDYGEDVDADLLMSRKMELDLRISGQLPRVLVWDRRGFHVEWEYTLKNYGPWKEDWEALLKAGTFGRDSIGMEFWDWYYNQIYPGFHWVRKLTHIPLTRPRRQAII